MLDFFFAKGPLNTIDIEGNEDGDTAGEQSFDKENGDDGTDPISLDELPSEAAFGPIGEARRDIGEEGTLDIGVRLRGCAI